MQDTLDLLYDNGYDPDFLEGSVVFDGLRDALIGTTEDGRLVYNYNDIIQIFMDRDNMTLIEAIEYTDYNIVGFKLDNPKCPIIVFPIHK